MFTNAGCTLFRKGVDTKTRLPTWDAVNIPAVYWEQTTGQTSVSNQNGSHEMKQNDNVLVIIPKKHVPSPMPQKGDLIALGTDAERDGAFTIRLLKNFLYGSEDVQHIEVTAV